MDETNLLRRSNVRRNRKSRKGSCNVNKKYVQPVVDVILNEINNESLPSSSRSSTDDIVCVPNVDTDASKVTSNSSGKVFRELHNKSEEKLRNSSFKLLEASPSKKLKTRAVTKQLCLRKGKKVHVASGYKIVDFQLLQTSIASSARCIKCKKKTPSNYYQIPMYKHSIGSCIANHGPGSVESIFCYNGFGPACNT